MVNTRSNKMPITITARKSTNVRNHNVLVNANTLKHRVHKRKADSPAKNMSAKRSAFGDITNAMKAVNVNDTKPEVKRVTVHAKILPAIKTVVRPKDTENVQPPAVPQKKIVTRLSLKNTYEAETIQKPRETLKIENRVKTRLSNEFDKTEDSLYSSALENLCDSTKSTKSTTVQENKYTKLTPVKLPKVVTKPKKEIIFNIGDHNVPEGVKDFDKENWDDTHQVSHYAMDIFNYMKNRELNFIIEPYMDKQVCLTTWMRSLLVDWMVEVQESFELNHETLYLGVKLVDMYLSKVIVSKETLQLVGAAAMFVASKYDERIPPLIDDFLYICDGAYTRRELIRMEMNVLKICNFNLGIPLSYRFLRRYARCAKVSMPILTLARYILEYSLMDYAIVHLSDSKLAAAALYLALCMRKIPGWTQTLEFYTGYELDDFFNIVIVLNGILHRKPREQLSTVRNKYSHKIFFQVAKTELIPNEQLK